MGDELVGDAGQGDLGNIQLVLGDQGQEEVERPLEDVQVDLEGAWGRRPVRRVTRVAGRHGGHSGSVAAC
jgi:hypothetical protein